MLLEMFEGKTPTGVLVLFQIKGRTAPFRGEITQSVPVKTLRYAQMFEAPLFLVSVSLDSDKAYFVWLQKYIHSKLFSENPEWDRQGTVTVHFPKDNVLDERGLEKIRSLATYTAHRDAGFSFLAHLTWLKRHVERFHGGGGGEELTQALVHLGAIEKLGRFLAQYEDHVEDLDIAVARKAMAKAAPTGTFDYGDDDLVDRQLEYLAAIQLMFLSKHEMDAFMAEGLDELLPY